MCLLHWHIYILLVATDLFLLPATLFFHLAEQIFLGKILHIKNDNRKLWHRLHLLHTGPVMALKYVVMIVLLYICLTYALRVGAVHRTCNGLWSV